MTHTTIPEPSPANAFLRDHTALLLRSYRLLTGCDLLPPLGSEDEMAEALYRAPFVVLSHSADADPLFTYANLAAQRRFAMSWRQIVGMPSRYSAETPAREERQALLERVARQGYIDDYQGIRIASTGERFRIKAATVWNLIDAEGEILGQAATFSAWEPLAE